jgi:glycerophosphoryl diester phosphodiesterase
MPHAWFDLPRPLVFGHRGAGGEAPENTLVSFERAVAAGADVLELDVHASRDGVIVVMHDPTLERTTDGSGLVREHTWSDLQRLDAGSQFTTDGRSHPFRNRGVRPPSLDEVFQRFPRGHFNIEVKQSAPAIAGAVVDLVLKHRLADRVVLAAEQDAIMREIRAAAAGRVLTSLAAGEVADFVGRFQSDALRDYRSPGCALQIPPAFNGIELVTAESVRAAHGAGMEIHVWTINHRDDMDRLLGLGVDGIMSDLPALARAAVDGYGVRRPAVGGPG